MARYWYGGGVPDWAMTSGDPFTLPGVVARGAVIIGGVSVTFWNARTGGTQHDALLDEAGSPVGYVVASDGVDGRGLGQLPPFRGPDGVREMWAQAGNSPRSLILGRVDAVDRNGDAMKGPLVLADGSPAASQAYAMPRSGGALTGPLELPGPPSLPNHAATKAYVDSLGGGGSGAVASVNGKTGVVLLVASDVGASPAGHTHTTAQVAGLDAALAGKAAISHDHLNRAAAYRFDGAGYVPATDAGLYVGPIDPGGVPDGSVWVDTSE